MASSIAFAENISILVQPTLQPYDHFGKKCVSGVPTELQSQNLLNTYRISASIAPFTGFDNGNLPSLRARGDRNLG
jgi:hypothetical protein